MMQPAATPSPPYYAVIFTSVHHAGGDAYAETAQRMAELAAQQPGFLGFETAHQKIRVKTILRCNRPRSLGSTSLPTGLSARTPRPLVLALQHELRQHDQVARIRQGQLAHT